MLKVDRHRMIEEELRLYGSLLISDMSKKLNCSEETIRRDLNDLETQRKLKRIHGGAFLPETEDRGAPVHLKETFLPKEKGSLASFTLKNHIREGETIMLDSSTTCLTLAQQLSIQNMKLTIITNSLRICSLFDKQVSSIRLIAIGGTFRQKASSFVGYQATDAVSHYVADKCFISCSAIDLVHGLLDNSQDESQVRKAFIRHSQKNFLIADHTKFSDTADYIITGLDSVDTVITDKKLSAAWEKTLKEHKLPVQYC